MYIAMKKVRGILSRVGLGLLVTAVAAYFGMEIFRVASDPLTTALVERSVAEETVEVSGFVVRQETVLENQSGLMSLLLNEGEKVGAGQAVAILYKSDDALARQEELEALQVKRRQLEYAESVALGAATALRFDSEIWEELLRLRSDIAAEGLGSGTEARISSLRSMIMQRDYSARGEDPTEELKKVEEEIEKLERELSRSAQEIKTPAAGIYSAAVDGYETLLLPETVGELLPSELESLSAGSDYSAIGKLIGSAKWYFAAVLDSSTAGRLRAGGTAELRFPKLLEDKLNCRVESIGEEEDGKRTVVFSCTRYLADMTRARHAEAEIIFESWEGLRIAKKALRVNENGQSGVYCLVGLSARFKPVTVVYKGEDYCLVAPDDPSGETTRIREGDQAIIAAEDLYDGKVVG